MYGAEIGKALSESNDKHFRHLLRIAGCLHPVHRLFSFNFESFDKILLSFAHFEQLKFENKFWELQSGQSHDLPDSLFIASMSCNRFGLLLSFML